MEFEMTDAEAKTTNLGGKYLTFHLGAESYGIAVLKIREIMRLQPITAVPQMPSHIRGVLNLRGKIIPVVDLRVKFGFPSAEATDHTCIIVVQIASVSNRMVQMGLIVDGVEEVLNIGQKDIEETPDFGTSVDTSYILGMAKIHDAVKALLDIDRVLVSDTGLPPATTAVAN